MGHTVGEGVKPPKESEINAMFCVSSPERTWYLYAETESEAREWISVLEQARAPLSYGGPHNPPGAAPYPSYGAPGYGSAPNAAAYGVAPSGPPPIGFNPSIIQGAGASGPPPPYSQVAPQPQAPYGQPPPYPSGPPPPGYAPYPQPPPVPQPTYPPQAPGGYPQQAPGQYYPTPPPGQYPQQQYYPAQHTTYVQGGKPQTVYVQQPHQQSSGRKNMMMGAAAGVVGGAAMGYMLGHAVGGFGHHGFGGWGSDHSWSSGGSFDCDFD